MSVNIHWRSIPVPYIAAWTDERDVYVSEDRNAGGRLAVFRNGRRGAGEPLFGKMDESRQREVIARRRCQVCRVKLDGGPAFALDINYNAVTDGSPVIQEPPVCWTCARLALTICPGNRRLRERGELLSFEVYEYGILAQLLKPSSASNADVHLSRALSEVWPQPVVGYLKAVLTRYRPIAIEAIMEAPAP
jgi:hypothetical protein